MEKNNDLAPEAGSELHGIPQPTQSTNSAFKIKIKSLSKRWFIDAFSGMALGLFATLIAGTILAQLGALINGKSGNAVGNLLISVANIAKMCMGAGIGAGVATSLKGNKLTVFACAAAGLAGALAIGWLPNLTIIAASGKPGNPIGAFITALIAAELCNLVSGKTKLDIIVVPLTALFVACIAVITICPPITWLLEKMGEGIALSIRWNPLVMGIVIAVIMGNLLTLPTSSAATWISIAALPIASELTGEMLLAGGAAVVGCACHMVGFAVMSYRENGFSGLIAQGLGTSMLQIPNLMKNPRILIPPTVASVVCGALSTTVFKLKCGATGGGMGTSGFVGVLSTIEYSTDISPWMLALGILLLMFILPAFISQLCCLWLRKIGYIKENDLKLEL